VIEEALASLKRGGEKERERERERVQTDCLRCLCVVWSTNCSYQNEPKRRNYSRNQLPTKRQIEPPGPPPKKRKQNSVGTGPLWETADDRKFSQRFSIKCVCFEVCARRPPTLVLKYTPNNRLGNFPEIWIHLIAHWFWIPFAHCGSQSKEPVDTRFSMIRGPWFSSTPNNRLRSRQRRK